MGRLWGIVCLLPGIVLIAGCSSGGGRGSSSDSAVSAAATAAVTEEAVSAPKSGAEVRALLSQAGVGCTSFSTIPMEKREVNTASALDAEYCEIDGEKSPKITVWKDEGQLENWEGFMRQTGCAMAKPYGLSNFDWVKGELWTVWDVSQTLADKIGAATGATPVHVKCQ